ncbi:MULTISPECIES: hypothetical protein [unclassified Mycolicibacterium]|nr:MULTISPECIES: hypothetical protein [unclassified Mycolicibacterium]
MAEDAEFNPDMTMGEVRRLIKKDRPVDAVQQRHMDHLHAILGKGKKSA